MKKLLKKQKSTTLRFIQQNHFKEAQQQYHAWLPLELLTRVHLLLPYKIQGKLHDESAAGNETASTCRIVQGFSSFETQCFLQTLEAPTDKLLLSKLIKLGGRSTSDS